MALALGAGLVVSMLGAVPASAAPKKKRADLVVSAAAVSPNRVVPGGVLKVKDTTRNRGRKVAKRSVTRYVLSKNKKVDKKDVVLLNRTVRRLKRGKKHAIKWRKVRVPARTKPGSYWLLVCADARRKVRESNERNNCYRAKKRFTVAKKQPPIRSMKVDITAVVDVKRRYHHSSPPFDTKKSSDVRLNAKGTGTLVIENGKPTMLTWLWSSATTSGTAVYDAEGMVYGNACPWTAYTTLTKNGSAVNVRPMGGHTGGVVSFPASSSKTFASFGLEHKLGEIEVPRIGCEGPIASERLELALRQSWWSKDPTYTIRWSKDFSKITWREHVTQRYVPPSGDSTEDQSYTADGTLSLKPSKK